MLRKAQIRKISISSKTVRQMQIHFVSLFILWSILFFSITLVVFLFLGGEYRDVHKQLRENAYKYYYWKKVADEHPNFPDALIQAALYAESLGYYEEAVGYLNAAQWQDPGSTQVAQLKEKVFSKIER